jgi:deoxyxylulose-5-phosphate synthase
MKQAAVGRVVMSVDCTALLNMRHVFTPRDDAWRREFPPTEEVMTFEEVRVYEPTGDGRVTFAADDGTASDAAAAAKTPDAKKKRGSKKATPARVAVVAYGNGVITSLQAREALAATHGVTDVTVIDCPYLTRPPEGLVTALRDDGYTHVVFADICKQGQNPFGNFVTTLQSAGVLPHKWRLVAAAATYNPLGQLCTFLNEDDVVDAVLAVMEQ